MPARFSRLKEIAPMGLRLGRPGQEIAVDGIWAGANGPWLLVWKSEPLALGEARKLENLLKRQNGGAGFYRITGLRRNSR